MYDVALSVLACLRANTDVHVAWLVEGPSDRSDNAVALTPGGGRIGSLLGGSIDDAVLQALPSVGNSGGIVDISVGPAEALIGGLPEGSQLSIALAPGSAIPEDIWESLVQRNPVMIAFQLDGTSFDGFERVETGSSPADSDDLLVCSFTATPRALIVGSGPIAESLASAFRLVGWDPIAGQGPGEASGIAPTLAPIDGVVVMGHDVEQSGRSLQAAIESRAGYIASLGSISMQDMRKEWLAYRGVSWDARVHGPAGLAIGASSPGEIAVSIVAEAIASSQLDEPRDR